MGNDNGNGSPTTQGSLNKPRYSLIPAGPLYEIAKAFTLGAPKHGDYDWRRHQSDEYIDKIYRHIEAYRMGEKADPESGLSHLAHAGADLMILMALEAGDGE